MLISFAIFTLFAAVFLVAFIVVFVLIAQGPTWVLYGAAGRTIMWILLGTTIAGYVIIFVGGLMMAIGQTMDVDTREKSIFFGQEGK